MVFELGICTRVALAILAQQYIPYNTHNIAEIPKCLVLMTFIVLMLHTFSNVTTPTLATGLSQSRCKPFTKGGEVHKLCEQVRELL
jgi:hypothetical protein